MSKAKKTSSWFKRGDRVFLGGEANPCTITKVIEEADSGTYRETGPIGSGKQWVNNWRYRVRDAKGREFTVTM